MLSVGTSRNCFAPFVAARQCPGLRAKPIIFALSYISKRTFAAPLTTAISSQNCCTARETPQPNTPVLKLSSWWWKEIGNLLLMHVMSTPTAVAHNHFRVPRLYHKREYTVANCLRTARGTTCERRIIRGIRFGIALKGQINRSRNGLTAI